MRSRLLARVEDDVLDDLVAVGVDLVEPGEHLLVVDDDAVQLVAQRHPVRVHVVRPPEELDFPDLDISDNETSKKYVQDDSGGLTVGLG